jgi:virginiamycin B lyase
LGPDSAFWFDQYGGSVVGRITTNGQVTEFKIPSAGALLGSGLVTSGDGNLWFGEIGKVGRVTASGQVTEFPIPGVVPPEGNAFTMGRASNGDIWLDEVGEIIGLVDSTGSVAQFHVDGGEIVSAINGSDDALWFTQGKDIERMTLDGHITVFPTTTGGRISLFAGPGNTLLFSDSGGQVGSISTDGKITLIARIPGLAGMTLGPDGNLWFTQDQSYNDIGRLTLAGAITTFKLPTVNSAPSGIIVGPDGNLWFGEFHGERIGRITP